MITPPFIQSLHRPFNQQLKAAKWVCQFTNTRKRKIKSSTINVEFYLYILGRLHKHYSLKPEKDYAGIPSRNAIEEVYSYFDGKTKQEKIDIIQEAIKIEREEVIDKQIYSTYKAASYYVNMAKDKFSLINLENKISKSGEKLLSLRSGFLTYSDSEKLFFFDKILEADFLLFISLCFFKRLSYSNNFKDHISVNFDFLDKYYGISHFNFTSSSLGNYNTVRNNWLNILEVLDKRMYIRRRYIQIIKENPQYNLWYEDLSIKFTTYVKENFKSQKNYLSNKEKLENQYNHCLIEGKGDLGFVNLYDIKEKMRMSHSNFQTFLNKFYDNEKGRKHIFFNNIVSSIDRRKRFKVRGIPVLKIKIK